MQIIKTPSEWRQYRSSLSSAEQLGFVPTMGALHKGHGSLIDLSKQQNDVTAVSIFVNPTQFNRADDLVHYPRPVETDLAFLKNLDVDACFLPEAEMIYADNYQFQIQENVISQCMEGVHRPGHFSGVLTVVMKLLNIIQPTRTYFGEKDYQQLQLVQHMVNAFFMNIEIIGGPTIREASGLPLSSRNARLNPEQRQVADQFARIFHQNRPLSDISSALNNLGIGVEYLEEHEQRRFVAVTIGDIRLIDNYPKFDR